MSHAIQPYPAEVFRRTRNTPALSAIGEGQILPPAYLPNQSMVVAKCERRRSKVLIEMILNHFQSFL